MTLNIIRKGESNGFSCCRDRVGERPLYWYEDDEQLIVASKIKDILRHVPGIRPITLPEFEALECICGARTLFEGINSLLPAHKLTCTSGMDISIEEYWQVANDAPLSDLTPGQALDYLDELLRESITACIPTDVPWALYLSGGIDSSIIAAIAKPDLCFTCNFPCGPKYDELHYAQAVAEHIGTELVVVQPTQSDFKRSLDDIICHLEMPVASFSAFPLYFLARAASERGVEVILSGEGADELFSGYTRHLILSHENALYDIPAMQNYGPLLDYYFGSTLDRFSRLLSRRDGMAHVVRNIISPHFTRFDDVIHAMGYTEFKVLLPTILHMEHQMAATFGIQNRNPYLDHRIVQFAFSIPGELKLRDYETKWLVRNLARRYLPPDVADRRGKMGLIFPYGLWFPSDGTRGEFDRRAYSQLCYDQWYRMFFGERQWATHQET